MDFAAKQPVGDFVVGRHRHARVPKKANLVCGRPAEGRVTSELGQRRAFCSVIKQGQGQAAPGRPKNARSPNVELRFSRAENQGSETLPSDTASRAPCEAARLTTQRDS